MVLVRANNYFLYCLDMNSLHAVSHCNEQTWIFGGVHNNHCSVCQEVVVGGCICATVLFLDWLHLK